MTELSNKRETKPSDDTGDKKPLDFSNAKIEKCSPTFGNARNLYIPFKVPHGSKQTTNKSESKKTTNAG